MFVSSGSTSGGNNFEQLDHNLIGEA